MTEINQGAELPERVSPPAGVFNSFEPVSPQRGDGRGEIVTIRFTGGNENAV